MLKKITKIIAGLLAAVVLVCIVVYVTTGPEQPAANSSSAQWLESGPYNTAQRDFVFVDESRPTSENNGVAGKPDRTFPTTIWYPEGSEVDAPLIIHSHGFVSSRDDLSYMAELLASHGYVVAATDYPLTSGATAGGPNASDVINQPGDISFLIDTIIALQGSEKPFSMNIDSERIGLTGYSLGGLTTSLATYHPEIRDSRIAAAVSIAGPSSFFTRRFYEHSDVPFLMIAGTSDALVDHDSNAAIIPTLNRHGDLLSIAGGTHLGFASLAEPLFRFAGNPDALGCGAVLGNIEGDPNEAFESLGTSEQGIVVDPEAPGVCEKPLAENAAHPGRQHMITQLGVLSFFESVFALSEEDRRESSSQLTEAIARDFSEASYLP